MFSGTYTALVTPFKDGKVDFDAYGKLIERQIEGKVEGILPAGCTGEAATLNHDEQIELIDFAAKTANGRVKVLAGTGSNNTQEAIMLTERASKLNIDAILVITPYYNKPGPRGLQKHYQLIAEASSVPVMLYNVPSRTGLKMSPEQIADLHEIDGIQSVKEACGSVEQVSSIRHICDINIMSGDDSLAVPMMSVGASGVVSVAANVAPLEVSSMIRCALDNDFVAASKAHFELLHLFKSLFFETNPIPVKTVLGEMGLIEKELRLPLTYGESDTQRMARSLIERYDLK